MDRARERGACTGSSSRGWRPHWEKAHGRDAGVRDLGRGPRPAPAPARLHRQPQRRSTHLRPLLSSAVQAVRGGSAGPRRDAAAQRTGREGFLETVDALVGLLDEAGAWRSVDLLGYSQGARFALAAALRRPERFGRLIMESGSPGLHRRKERAERREADAAAGDLHPRRGAWRPSWTRWEALPLFEGLRRLPPSEREAPARAPRRLHGGGAGGGAGVPGAGRAAGLLAGAAPPAAAHAAADRGAGREVHADSRAGWRRSCRWCGATPSTDCGHAPHLEAPEAYAREVLSFLQTPWYEAPQFESPPVPPRRAPEAAA